MNQPNGETVVVGEFANPAKGVERLNEAGTSNSAFQQAGGIYFNSANQNIIRVYHINEDPAGGLYIGGNFFSYQGVSTRPVIKIAGGVSPYDLWVRENFTPAQIANGDADPDADPDGDDIDNLAELGGQTNPNVADPDNVFRMDAESGIELVEISNQFYLQITIDKTGNAPGPWYTGQFSSDLQTWSPANPTPASTEFVIIENSDTRFIVRDAVPTTPASPRFGRVTVVSPQ